MSEIQHNTRAHAVLSASSSHRWMMCPPSVKLSERFADKQSPYAEEGTFLHELCELKLHRYLEDMPPEVLEAQYAAHRDILTSVGFSFVCQLLPKAIPHRKVGAILPEEI